MEDGGERTLSDDKHVAIMADYGSDGLWDRDGVGVGADELPVTAGLKARIAAWLAAWEVHDPYRPDADLRTSAAIRSEGQAIADAVRAELPGWTVEYR